MQHRHRRMRRKACLLRFIYFLLLLLLFSSSNMATANTFVSSLFSSLSHLRLDPPFVLGQIFKDLAKRQVSQQYCYPGIVRGGRWKPVRRLCKLYALYTAMIQLAYGRLFTDVAFFTFNYYSALFHFCVFASRKAKPSQAKPKTSKKRRRENSAQRCDECNLIQPSIQQLTAVSLFSFRLSLFFFLLCFSLTILPFVLSFAFFLLLSWL